ncbi:MAG: fluoride efflux transporter CrcB [Firmicutes bacterium HGW-Firmicutes-14]|nr:MAG: fluoride efflux transporter CrcB [Firmicutes bacterium HGW-Firmicutes-14]
MDYLAVAMAGFFGAVARAVLGEAVKGLVVTAFPLGIFIVNITGCFILSFFLRLTLERLEINPRLRLAIGTGFLGAYTTFSTFAVDSINLIRSDQIWISLAYIVGTPVGCTVMAMIGAAAGKGLTERRDTGTGTSE